MPDTTIFTAKKVVTMNPSNPEATAVAVRDGRILGVGKLDELEGWGDYILDGTFQDKVLVPGFVEAHTHVGEGGGLAFPYVGYFDRRAPDGTVWTGSPTPEAVIKRLKELDDQMEEPDEPLIAWGFDPIYFAGEAFTAADLDQVSTTRPLYIVHANLHLATVNTVLMRLGAITRETEMEGVIKGADGEPNGVLQEFAAMSLPGGYFKQLMDSYGIEQTIWNFGYAARNTGCTTVAELGTATLGDPQAVALWQKAVNDPAYPARVAMYFSPLLGGQLAPEEIKEMMLGLRKSDTDKLRFNGIKLFLDGSIQGFTARLRWPGHYNGAPNGIWNTAPDQLTDQLRSYHRAGLNVHVHCNGDEATEVFIDAVEEALKEVPWLDHRHTVQHCQLTSAEQYRKMARLGMCANIFTNHLWYWGDQHYELTIGPERANRMNACATARREGVRFSMHSDAPVTPLGHLHTMWCAVNRTTPKGRVLGPAERICVHDALYACTVDAAYQLHMDHEIGSIEVGKRADFAVLEADPFEVEPMALKDVPVWGTVVGGAVFEAPRE